MPQTSNKIILDGDEEESDEETGNVPVNGTNGVHDKDDDLPYDPNQNIEEKRRLRRDYRSMLGDELLQVGGALGTEQLTQRVQQLDTMFNKVKDVQTATIDSNLLVKVTHNANEKARQMRAGLGGFDIDDLVGAFFTYMGGFRPEDDDGDNEYVENSSLEWEKIGKLAMAKSRRVPAMDFMNGVILVEQKKRKPTQRIQREKLQTQQTQPQELRQEDITKSENETASNVVKLRELLDTGERMNIFNCIINPTSYGQSVENLFYLSFLIRDGEVALEIDEETEEPMIMLVEKPNTQDMAEGFGKKQMVVELDMETWKTAIEVFDIRESFFPTRKPAMQRMGDKWYG